MRADINYRGRYFQPVHNVRGDHSQPPVRATKDSAGYDVFSAEPQFIPVGEVVLVGTGIKSHMPGGEYLQLTLRSSFAIKNTCWMPNSPGIIDADYYDNEKNEGEIFVPVYNGGKSPILVQTGDKIAQGIFLRYGIADSEISPMTKRQGGLGSTDAPVLSARPNE